MTDKNIKMVNCFALFLKNLICNIFCCYLIRFLNNMCIKFCVVDTCACRSLLDIVTESIPAKYNKDACVCRKVCGFKCRSSRCCFENLFSNVVIDVGCMGKTFSCTNMYLVSCQRSPFKLYQSSYCFNSIIMRVVFFCAIYIYALVGSV